MANGIRDLRFTSESRVQRGFSIARMLSQIHQVKVESSSSILQKLENTSGTSVVLLIVYNIVGLNLQTQ